MNTFNLLLKDAELWWGLPKKLEWLETVVNAIKGVLWPFLILVATAGSIYAIYLAMSMARAEDKTKREGTKKRLISIIIATGITVTLTVLVLTLIIPNIPSWASKKIDKEVVDQIASTPIDINYDSRVEIEEVFGSPIIINTYDSTYRFMVSGKRFEMVVTYNGEGKVTKVVVTQPTDYTVDNNTENQE